MKYEYKVLKNISNLPLNFTVDTINLLGKEGWRAVNFSYSDDDTEVVLLERVIEK